MMGDSLALLPWRYFEYEGFCSILARFGRNFWAEAALELQRLGLEILVHMDPPSPQKLRRGIFPPIPRQRNKDRTARVRSKPYRVMTGYPAIKVFDHR
jgi:hypothetical protein